MSASPTQRLIALAVVMSLATLVFPTGIGGVRPVRASEPCVDGWAQLPFGSRLDQLEAQGVATLAGEPAWLVGIAGAGAEGGRSPVVARWIGGAWTKISSSIRGYGSLNEVEVLPSGTAWTVGSSGSYTRWPISARWNGSSWSAVAVPRPAGETAVLTDLAVVKANRLWAAGNRLISGQVKPYALLRSYGRWRDRSPRVAAGVEGGLTAMTRAPGGRIWAAGWKTDSEGQGRAWIVHRRSGGWRATPVATHGRGRSAITDMVFTGASSGWAVGYAERDAGGGYEPLLQRWDGSSWSGQGLPWAAGRSIVLNAVQADAAGRLRVVGTEIDELRGAIIATRDASGWQVRTIAPGTPGRAVMMDVASLADGPLVVGYTDSTPLALVPCAAGAAATTIGSGPTSATDSDPAHDSTVVAEPQVSPAIEVAAVAGVVGVDVTATAGIDVIAPSWGGVAADFDKNGYDDLFLGMHFQEPGRLLLNGSAGVFGPVTGFERRDRHNCAAADVDASGKLDLFCTIGVNKGTSNTPQELLLDPSVGGGEWAALEFGVLDGYGRGRNATFLNLNDDGYPDLYIGNEPSRHDAMWSSNRLYRNVGGSHFVGAPAWGVDHPIGATCLLGADLDNDGDDELVVCTTEAAGGLSPGTRVFTNEDGHFVDRTATLGVFVPLAVDVEVADFDGDGRPDLAQLTRNQLTIQLARGASYATSFQLPLSVAIGIAVGDVNADDRPDIYVARRSAGNSGHLMLLNDGDGASFSSLAIPQPGAGQAEEVLAIDWDHNGRTDFVTLNGAGTSGGPVKLTAFFPAP